MSFGVHSFSSITSGGHYYSSIIHSPGMGEVIFLVLGNIYQNFEVDGRIYVLKTG